MAKKLVDLVGGQTSGSKTSGGNQNNRYENRYTDAVTGEGVGISKTDYSRPNANAYPNGLGGNLYTEAIKNGTYTPPGYYRDGLGLLLPGSEPPVGNFSQDTIETVAKNMERKKNTQQSNSGQQPGATPSSPTQPGTTPSSPTQPGTSGGDKVTYIDANGDAQKGTTTPSQAASDPQQSYLDALRDQYQKAYEDAVRASDALRARDQQAYEDAVKANDALLGQYQKMYEDAVKANNDAAKAAAERALAQVEQGIGELGEQYGGINKQLYRDYMESLRVLPQELAARGYNGGMSESARLGLDTAYGERLNENEAARIAAIMQLRQQGADAEYQANAARDQANAEAQQNLYAAAAAREQANAEAQQNLYAAAVARDQANAEAQQNLYANFINLLLQQQQDAATKAQNMAQYGDFSGYLGLGYSQSQIDAMKKAWIAANPEMAQALGFVKAPETSSGSSGGSGSYGGSNGGGTQTPSETQKENGRNLLSEAIRLRNGGTPYSDIANALDEEAAEGSITPAQAEAAKRAAISSGLDSAYASLKKQESKTSGSGSLFGRQTNEGDLYSQILGGRK